MENLEKRLENFKDMTKIQCTKGNYDQGEYFRGMANGMILGVATLEGKAPIYIKAPLDKQEGEK